MNEYGKFTDWLKDNSNLFGATIMSVKKMAQENNLTTEQVLSYLEMFEEEYDGWFRYFYFFDTEDMIEYYLD